MIGSYPFPGWLEFTAEHLDRFGAGRPCRGCRTMRWSCALHDQLAAGLDVITDGEQTRLDFNLSFYGFLEGIDPEAIAATALWSPRARPARKAPRRRRAQSAAGSWRRPGIRVG